MNVIHALLNHLHMSRILKRKHRGHCCNIVVFFFWSRLTMAIRSGEIFEIFRSTVDIFTVLAKFKIWQHFFKLCRSKLDIYCIDDVTVVLKIHQVYLAARSSLCSRQKLSGIPTACFEHCFGLGVENDEWLEKDSHVLNPVQWFCTSLTLRFFVFGSCSWFLNKIDLCVFVQYSFFVCLVEMIANLLQSGLDLI